MKLSDLANLSVQELLEKDSFSGAAGLTPEQLQCAAQSRQVWLRASQVNRQVMAAALGLRIKSRMLSVAMLNTPESRAAALASTAQAAAADSLALGTAAEAWAWEGIKHTPGPLLMDWAVLPGGGSGADVLVSGSSKSSLMVRVLEQSGRLPSPAMTASDWEPKSATGSGSGVSDSVLWLLGAEALLQLVQVHGVRPGFDWWSSLLQRLADHTPLHPAWQRKCCEGIMRPGKGVAEGSR
ncbi:hypothetical protein HaLaN_15056 [Haematococcus lacustris]|uniref:Uncharacterized protein n=1 Tax=Haematococcus lacustris TaxID=44745 RepID=A0A699ZQS4_HAELA|nr:hypothetical protein HaLaN_15056 [Haematococcus lacustris]